MHGLHASLMTCSFQPVCSINRHCDFSSVYTKSGNVDSIQKELLSFLTFFWGVCNAWAVCTRTVRLVVIFVGGTEEQSTFSLAVQAVNSIALSVSASGFSWPNGSRLCFWFPWLPIAHISQLNIVFCWAHRALHQHSGSRSIRCFDLLSCQDISLGRASRSGNDLEPWRGSSFAQSTWSGLVPHSPSFTSWSICELLPERCQQFTRRQERCGMPQPSSLSDWI